MIINNPRMQDMTNITAELDEVEAEYGITFKTPFEITVIDQVNGDFKVVIERCDTHDYPKESKMTLGVEMIKDGLYGR